jgi:hypothetical protein
MSAVPARTAAAHAAKACQSIESSLSLLVVSDDHL